MPAAQPAKDRSHRQRDQKRRHSIIDRVRAAWGKLKPQPQQHQRKDMGYGHER
jgi:hypothetical protein